MHSSLPRPSPPVLSKHSHEKEIHFKDDWQEMGLCLFYDEGLKFIIMLRYFSFVLIVGVSLVFLLYKCQKCQVRPLLVDSDVN